MKNRNTYQNRRMNKRFNEASRVSRMGWTLAQSDPTIQETVEDMAAERTIYEGVFPDIVEKTYLQMDESEFRKALMFAYTAGFTAGACPWKRYENR